MRNKLPLPNAPSDEADSTRAALAYVAVWLFATIAAGAYIDHLSSLFH